MYSYEQRIKAVELYIKYDMCGADVRRELGYPNRHTLLLWYKEFKEKGELHQSFTRKSKFSNEQKQAAVDYYLEHGKSVSRTLRKMGYPSRNTFKEWIDELAPGKRKHGIAGSKGVKYPKEKKEQAVLDFCSRDGSAEDVAKEHGVCRESLYKWKDELLPGGTALMKKKQQKDSSAREPVSESEAIKELQSNISALKEERDALEAQVYRLKMERDIYEKIAELIKKDQGISIPTLSNREKAIVINALRERYPLKDLLATMQMAKSSYCYQSAAMKTDKYAQLREQLRQMFEDAKHRYGYRRLHSQLKTEGQTVSEKVVRRIMHEEQLIVPNIKRKKYSSYKGEISPEVPNIINRDFHADNPNEKWLTDITEFHIPAGKVYLSPIIDCFDGMPVSWTIGTSPDAELVNTMLDNAVSTLAADEHPTVHSDRGAHYRWPGWIERMEAAGLTRSMSKKGCSPDNSACEGFFGRLKNEMFYGLSWNDVSIDEFIEELDRYMHWYVEERIKLSLGGMSPAGYRKSLGLTVA